MTACAAIVILVSWHDIGVYLAGFLTPFLLVGVSVLILAARDV